MSKTVNTDLDLKTQRFQRGATCSTYAICKYVRKYNNAPREINETKAMVSTRTKCSTTKFLMLCDFFTLSLLFDAPSAFSVLQKVTKALSKVCFSSTVRSLWGALERCAEV